MSTRETTKLIARNVVAFSTSFAIGNVISSNARPKNKLQEAEIWVGSVACGMMVGNAAAEKTNRAVDAIFDVLEGKKDPSVIVVH